MKVFQLQDFPLNGKKVFVRTNYDVIVKNNKVVDETKILASIPTLKFLLAKQCTVIIGTHLGRPAGKVKDEFRLKPIVETLKSLLPRTKINYVQDCLGEEVKKTVNNAKQGEIVFLENLRFYKEEKENDPAFAHALANLVDVCVNEAFSNSHRKHASMNAITKFIPSIAGLHLQKELNQLQKAVDPKKPSVWLLGGAKLDKVQLIEQALQKADLILIGGALAFPFFKAQGIKVGMSKVDARSVETAEKILKNKKSKKIILPLDFVTTKKFTAKATSKIKHYDKFSKEDIGLDLGPSTIELFEKHLKTAKTIVWNGPLGYFEWVKFSNATKEIGRFLGKLPATVICGGGETSTAIHKFHLEHKLTHVSTGGGASVQLLSGNKLPGIVALEKNYKKFRKEIH